MGRKYPSVEALILTSAETVEKGSIVKLPAANRGIFWRGFYNASIFFLDFNSIYHLLNQNKRSGARIELNREPR